jgi:small membrane protein
VTLATGTLLLLIAGLFAYDVFTLRTQKRALALQGLVFLGGSVLVAFPDSTTRVAHYVGVGRGVDFVLYVTVLWLVRESLVTRRERRELQGRLEEVVRAVALSKLSEQSPDASASTTR